ncbi:MAG TPA: hypothetical protein VK727_11245 [Steroidobacteraceae bacterium]|nr:hypothetical protein [Steroidobacteraceae bacterium]
MIHDDLAVRFPLPRNVMCIELSLGRQPIDNRALSKDPDNDEIPVRLTGLGDALWSLPAHTLQIGREAVRNMAHGGIRSGIDQNTHRLMVPNQRQACTDPVRTNRYRLRA